ncbi:DUF6966 domain-containing protein [Caedibacter taeniospiralis]|uniref:DUF6966 domain-containing protein n=1 Tax=Caedibacter taeniospiralis TaxID=28907 RepID=UPI000C273E4A|nr:hypothetical protein [Caedibacter taeniospiralis]
MDKLIRKLNHLRDLLKSCQSMLDLFGEKEWSDKIGQTTKADGIDPSKVLSWYGGMGSFNDLLISGYNGHEVKQEDEDVVNAELSDLRNKIYLEAKEIFDQTL